MVAIRFAKPERRPDGFVLLVEQGPVRTFRGEVYVCNESALASLEEHKIQYERVPHPVISGAVDPSRDPLV